MIKKIEKNKLGKTDYTVSKIGLGTVQFGTDYGFTKEKSQDEVNEILSYANSLGINFLDTAREYGNSEQKIGKYISENKNNFIVATKLKKIQNYDGLTQSEIRDSIHKSVEESLINLKLQHLDILQLHQTDRFLVNNTGFWEAIKELKDKSFIRSFGVSVYEENETIDLIENHIDVIDFFQIPFNIFDRRFSFLKDIVKKESIGIISRSTFLKGLIPCTIDSVPEELHDIKEYKSKLNMIADKKSLTAEELALIYSIKQDFINATIVGGDKISEVRENVNIACMYKDITIDEDELKVLSISESNIIDPRKWTCL